MVDDPWLTLVGIGEDGLDGVSLASRKALADAEVVFGARRHLNVVGHLAAECRAWPVPFRDGIPALIAMRGRQVVMLASGDPFWFGAGSPITAQLEPHEWQAIPAPSTFSLATAHLGWALQSTVCLGLHSAPLSRLRPHIAPGTRTIVLLRDGSAVTELAKFLTAQSFGATVMHVLEALAGPRQRARTTTADNFDLTDIRHPVAVGLEFAGSGQAIPLASGRPDTIFEHDGQITKRPIRALTLSALAPIAGEHLWDIGTGSGSIAIEWLLSHPTCRATAIEANPARATRARMNAETLGVDRLAVIDGKAPAALSGLERPDAVFIGGGLCAELLDALWQQLPPRCRIVANAVTLESETLLSTWQARCGGTLMRAQLASVVPIGEKHGWQATFPIVQWSVTR